MDRSPDDLARSLENMVHGRSGIADREPIGEVTKECATHGPFTSNGIRYFGKREVWTRCPDCEEARLSAERQADVQRRADFARQQLECMIEQASIPARFIGRTFDNFHATTDPQRAALTIARDFAENFDARSKRGDSLILSGLPGTGKSHLAAAVLQALMPARCGMYTTCMNVIRSVRGTWRKDSERSETQVLNAYAEVPLLVLDEIGVQYGTDGEQTILFDVLDRRYRDMQPSIFLTNQDKKGFKEFIGERTFDRLTETARWVPFDWASYRPTARKEFSE